MNRVELNQYPNGQWQLSINGLPCVGEGIYTTGSTPFTSTDLATVITETNTYLGTSEGLSRVRGLFTDLTDSKVIYDSGSDSTSFDGTNNWKITINKRK